MPVAPEYPIEADLGEQFGRVVACPVCYGTGGVSLEYCPNCAGRGYFGGRPELPTDARPGSREKVIAMSLRYAEGLPLTIGGDRTEHHDAGSPYQQGLVEEQEDYEEL